MGWWVSNTNGGIDFDAKADDGDMVNHFPGLDDPNMPLWGDEPADIMGEAIAQISALWVSRWGRLPSVDEIQRGIRFTVGDAPVNSPLSLPATVADAMTVDTMARKVVAGAYDVVYDSHVYDRATVTTMADVMSALKAPYRP